MCCRDGVHGLRIECTKARVVGLQLCRPGHSRCIGHTRSRPLCRLHVGVALPLASGGGAYPARSFLVVSFPLLLFYLLALFPFSFLLLSCHLVLDLPLGEAWPGEGAAILVKRPPSGFDVSGSTYPPGPLHLPCSHFASFPFNVNSI